MPAAAVIPAPIAYIKVVAVKKLVVGADGLPMVSTVAAGSFLLASPRANQDDYFEEIRVFKAGLCSDILAWNNRIGRMVLFCWFLGPS